MAYLTIDGVAMPSPIDYKVKCYDADSDSTGRDDGYYLYRDRIRAGAYRIDVTWKLSGSEYLTVANALKPVSFRVIFFDPNTASYVTRDAMYAGDRDGTLVANSDNDHPEASLWELTCPIVEY